MCASLISNFSEILSGILKVYKSYIVSINEIESYSGAVLISFIQVYFFISSDLFFMRQFSQCELYFFGISISYAPLQKLQYNGNSTTYNLDVIHVELAVV